MTIATIGGRTADTYSGFLDTVISQALPSSTGSTGTTFQVANAVSGSAKKSIFKVTGISNIAGPVVVNSATFSFYRVNSTTSPNRGVVLKKLLRDVSVSQTTWNIYQTALNWQTSGASGALDVDSTIIATGTVPFGNSQRFTVTGAGLTSLVQDIINGVAVNPWLILEIDDPATFTGGDYDIGATDRPTESQRPYLEINYTSVTPPNISINDSNVTNLSGQAQLTVDLSASFSSTVTVDYTTVNGTAIAGTNYTASTGTLTFAPGETSKNILVDILP